VTTVREYVLTDRLDDRQRVTIRGAVTLRADCDTYFRGTRDVRRTRDGVTRGSRGAAHIAPTETARSLTISSVPPWLPLTVSVT
jgi:hypothetical protein